MSNEKRGTSGAQPRPTRLSATFVRTIAEPGRFTDGLGGFGLSLLVKVSTSGRITKSWAQRIRAGGRFRYIGLGPYPLVSLAEAREAAFQNAREVRAGVDPLADRKRKAATPAFEDAAEKVIDLHIPHWKDGGRTAAIWRARLAEYVYPRVGSAKVDTLTTADILEVLTPVWATKRETSRKIRQYLDAILAWCVAEGFISSNPADAKVIRAALPRAGGQTNHQPALAYADVPAALAFVEASDAAATTKLAIRFLTLTACRSGEVRGARWHEIDREAATWTIPGARMKTGREHRVPLSAAAMTVLGEAGEYADGSGLVFPSPTGKVLSDSTMSKVFRSLNIAATPHGMRSSFRVWAAECSDAPREIAEMALAHVEGSAAELAYRRTDYFNRRRELMEAWAAALTSR